MVSKIANILIKRSERLDFVREFNKAYEISYINRENDILMKAEITPGVSAFRHSHSWFLGAGFRIVASSREQISKKDLIGIGNEVTSDQVLVRNLITLGWDTLEIISENNKAGCNWQLSKYQ